MSLIDKCAALTGWRKALTFILIGILGVFGHAPFHIWLVTIIVLAIFMRLIVLAETPRKAFWGGLFFAFGYFMGQVYWIGSAFIARGPEFIPAMPPMIFGLALILAVFWAFAAYLFQRSFSKTAWPYLALAGLLFLAEYTRGHVLSGFPWDLPGYVFKAGGPMSQSASLFGIYGLSLLVLLVSALTAKFLWAKSRLSLGLAALLMAGNFTFGFLRLSNAQVKFVDNVKLRIVTVPFDQKEKMDFDNPEKGVAIVQEHINVTARPGLEDITHVIWPEGAMDGIAISNMHLRSAVGDTLRSASETPAIWIMNSLRIEHQNGVSDPMTNQYYNTSFALSFEQFEEGEIIALDDKKKLVPFGEFIPGGKIIEKIGARVISSALGSITPADQKRITRFPGLPPGSSQICYEVIFSGLTPRPKDGDRPLWILNQSNDAWYGSSVGPHQHANIAKYRAIEEKIPVIRSAANGFSGVIDPYGRFLENTDYTASKAIDSKLPQSIGESFDLSKFNSLLALIISVFLLIAQRRRL